MLFVFRPWHRGGDPGGWSAPRQPWDLVRHKVCAGHGAALFERSEFAARPERTLKPHLIEWMVARTTHPDHRGLEPESLKPF